MTAKATVTLQALVQLCYTSSAAGCDHAQLPRTPS